MGANCFKINVSYVWISDEHGLGLQIQRRFLGLQAISDRAGCSPLSGHAARPLPEIGV